MKEALRAGISRALLLIAYGSIFLLTNLSGDRFPLVTWWPSLLTVLGAYFLFGTSGNKGWATVFLISGIGFQLHNLGYLTVNLMVLYWPVALIAIGTFMLVHSITTYIPVARRRREHLLAKEELMKPLVEAADAVDPFDMTRRRIGT